MGKNKDKKKHKKKKAASGKRKHIPTTLQPGASIILSPVEWTEIDKIHKLCEPIMEYLSAHHNPYWEICISESGIQAKQAEFWIPSGWQPSDADGCPVD